MGQNSSQGAKMTPPVRVIVVGAGCRGEIYSKFASVHPDRMKVVGVADPRKFARTKLQQQHKITDENTFDDWHSIVEREKFADAVLICTPDRLHKEPAVAFAKMGYHILLEKPMATTAEDCTAIVEACTQSGVMLSVGHVLRYDPVIHKIKELVDSGVIGDVMHIQHFEPVGFYHFAHSFVRGNWRNEAESSFVLLAKSCHDIDLIHNWAGARRCVKVSSFGSVSHFQKDYKPKDAADRCLDCSVEKHCPYSARKIYLDRVKQGHTGWPVSVICPNSLPDIESVTEALRTGPYGRCVYECDNDVCSNQVVNIEFEGGLTAAFSMVAFTEEVCKRKTTIYGSKCPLLWGGFPLDFGTWPQGFAPIHPQVRSGTDVRLGFQPSLQFIPKLTIRGELSYDGHEVRVFDFLTQRSTKHRPHSNTPWLFGMSGHGGADYHLMDAFISAVASNDPSLIRSGPVETLLSHLLVFEAERSRLEGRVVHCGDVSKG